MRQLSQSWLASFDTVEPVRADDNILPSQVITIANANLVNSVPGQQIITAQNIDTASFVSLTIVSVQSGSTHNLGNSFSLFGSSMAIAFSGLYKFSAAITAQDLGKLDSVVWQGTADPTTAIAMAKVWASARCDILGVDATGNSINGGRGSPTITAIRITDVLNPNNSFLMKMDENNTTYYGWTATNDAADAMSTSLVIRMKGQTAGPPVSTSTSNLILVGHPDKCVVAGRYTGTPIINGKSYNARVSGYLNFLTATGKFGFMGQSVLAADSKKVATNPVVATNLKWNLTIPAHGWTSLDKVRVTASDDVRFRGTTKILVVDANTIQLQKVITTDPTLMTNCLVQRVQTFGQGRKQSFFVYQAPVNIGSPSELISVSKKNLARPLALVSFKRRGRKA